MTAYQSVTSIIKRMKSSFTERNFFLKLSSRWHNKEIGTPAWRDWRVPKFRVVLIEKKCCRVGQNVAIAGCKLGLDKLLAVLNVKSRDMDYQ